MIGIKAIASYICEDRELNEGKIFDGEVVDTDFLINKVGVCSIAIKKPDEHASDLCIKAFNNFVQKYPSFDKSLVDCVCVCSQNRDYMFPNVSSIIHGKLDLPLDCATFDTTIGCSGYVYSLGIMKSYMEQNGLKTGLLFTSDPISEIVDKNDKSTAMIFGDAATVTLLAEDFIYSIGTSSFYSEGKAANVLIKYDNKPMFMDGRIVLSFTLSNISNVMAKNLKQENLTLNDIDLFVMHQPSKYIIDLLVRRTRLDPLKVPYDIQNYGNTSSSSIPIILEKNLEKGYNEILLCGFGVGLSVASTIIHKKN